MTSSDIKDAALTFEAVKVGIYQNRDGIMLKLAIHPNDIPDELMRSFVGSRYSVAMVEINEDETPKIPERHRAAHRAVASAHMLCREPKFWEYLYEAGLSDEMMIVDESEARGYLCTYLGISSRAELSTNEDAINKFDGVKGEFIEWAKHH